MTQAATPMPPPGARRRGSLRIYLGAAPGVGKTYDMLGEGRRARARGTDVVVGVVETYGRVHTAEQIGDLEMVPRRRCPGDAAHEEMDIDAVLARRPERVLVDELAHTNAPGSRNAKRWQDVEELLDAGIDVISTVNIQDLESVNDVVERITGVRHTETVPDDVVRAAQQVVLVDQTPEALRRRMAHGNIYDPERIDVALGDYFQAGNLAALRELALLWVADQVDVGLAQYRKRHGITDPWETRERVVVALTGAPGTESLIRRAARIAQRAHGRLLGVHVATEAAPATTGLLDEHRRLLLDVGGEYHEVAGAEVATALVEFARAESATQLVLGSSARSRWSELIRGSVINRVVRSSGPIDVHVISHERDRGARDERTHRATEFARSAIPARRRRAGWVLALVGIPLLAVILMPSRDSLALSTVLLLHLALVVTTAAAGGRFPALVGAVVALVSVNWFFTPPYHRFTVAEGENVIALVVFLGVALVVSGFVDAATRRAVEAARARGEARTLAGLAANLGEDDPLPVLLAHVRDVYGVDAVALLRRESGEWRVEAGAGSPVPARPEDATTVEPLGPEAVLALGPPSIAVEDQLVLKAFAAQLAVVIERTRLRAEAGRAESLAEANALRTALLQAVSHDLRTPLASIKASVSSLRHDDVEWSDAERTDFLRTIDEETDRLTRLVANLLDMSRIQAGAVRPVLEPVALDEVVPGAVASLGARGAIVDLEVSETLPPVLADATLLERAVANLVANAVRFSPADERVRLRAGVSGGHVDLRVIDHGRGVPQDQRQRVFQPFQRLGDSDAGTGVGLGLAVARGFLTAMGATVELGDTVGGGTTAIVRLRIAT